MEFDIDANYSVGKMKFLVSDAMKDLIDKTGKKPLYAGKYIGRGGKKRFIPSTATLAEQSKKSETRIILKGRGEWLFICGRNLWNESIKEITGKPEEGDELFIFNKHDECLGYGRFKKGSKIAVENIFDIGDFLRRERKGKKRQQG